MSRFQLITILLMLSAFTSFAQVDVNIRRGDMKQDKEGFRDAWQAVKEADDFYELGASAYPRAAGLYAKGYAYNNKVPELNYKYGVTLLHTVDYKQALEPLQKAYEKNPRVAFDILYQIARAYHLSYKFDKAIARYNKFRATLDPGQLEQLRNKLQDRINACKTAKRLVRDTARVFIDNLGPKVNSKWDDYNPLISADDSVLYFTSRRKETTGGEINPYNNQYYEDIYKTYKKGGKWHEAQNIGEPVNSDNNEAAVSLSSDGQKLYIYNGRRNNGDIYYSVLEGEEWERPDNLSRRINSRYHESSVAFSYNGDEML